MKNRNTACHLTHAHVTCREIDGVADIAVVYVIHDLFDSHSRTVIFRLLCGCPKMRNHNGAFHVDRFCIREIRHIAFYLLGGKSFRHVILIHQHVAGEV